MKLSYLEDLDERARPFGVKPEEMSEEDKVQARVAYLMRDVKHDREVEQAIAYEKRKLEALKKMRATRSEEDRHASFMTMFHEDDKGELVPTTVFSHHPTPKIQALMQQEDIKIFTGLVWNGMPLSDRAELAEKIGLDASLTTSSNVLEVLPKATLDWILGWQDEINAGHTWQSSSSVGERATWLISDGFCLMGKARAKDAYGNEQDGREDLHAGRPGTTRFVKAVMGDAYLAWLLLHEG